MNPPVYRTYGHYRWHWSDPRRLSEPGWELGSRCNGRPLNTNSATDPESTPAGDRCRANGCAQMWAAWTRGAA